MADPKKQIADIVAAAEPPPPLELVRDSAKPKRERKARKPRAHKRTAQDDDDIADAAERKAALALRAGELADGGAHVPPEIIDLCLEEPLNDTGNGKRLLYHFGADILNVREVGWHVWARSNSASDSASKGGSHWEREGGNEGVERCAQLTAARIAFEADRLAATKREQKILDAGEDAKKTIAAFDKIALLDEAQQAEKERCEASIDAAREVLINLSKRKAGRRKFAISSGNSGKITGMIARALPHKTVAPAELDADPLAFNVLNGTLRFCHERDAAPRSEYDDEPVRLMWRARLDGHCREDLIAKVAPVEYQPAAACPEWTAFLERVQPEQSVRDFLRDFYGYALTGLSDAQVFLYNWGSGANGKSTFIEALCRLFGPYARTLNPESFTGVHQKSGSQATPDLALLPGTRLLRVSELAERSPLQDNLVKAVTGGEPMMVRHNYAGFFEFRPVFKPSMSGNAKPNITDISEGMWRRIRLVPWLVRIPEEERKSFEEMQAIFTSEASGILNWLIAGAVRYLETRKLDAPEQVIEATAEHRDTLDPVGQFIAASLRRALGETIGAGLLYEYYLGWCKDSGVKAWSQSAFGRAMVKHQLEGSPIVKRPWGADRTVKYFDLTVVDTAAPRAPPDRTSRGSSEPFP